MMASNLLSRILPPHTGSPSIYETIRDHDEVDETDSSDVDERAGRALDEENLGENFHDLDLDHAQLEASQATSPGVRDAPRPYSRPSGATSRRKMARPSWLPVSQKLLDVEEVDDDVPASLLIEGDALGLPNLPPPPSALPAFDGPQGAEEPVHHAPARPRPRKPRFAYGLPALALADPKEKAMWRWANVENLDNFLHELYGYYLGHGFWSILLHRALSLVTLAFVVGFSYFLGACIDYRGIRGSTGMAEIVIPRCTSQMGPLANVVLWVITFVWISKLFQYGVDVRRLRHLHDFYHHLLDIAESDIQTISWQDVVSRLMALRDANPNIVTQASSARTRRTASQQNKERLDAHDIANRLMRRENYMIALVNKEILDLTLPIPFLRQRQLFSRTLEWNINQAVMDYVFNERGQIRRLFLQDTHRQALAEGLRRRFVFAGTANLIIAPFLIVYFLVQYFFQYFNEYQKNPGLIGSRQYNPLAEWKFREFNELYHLFQKRVNMSYPFATRYVNQFPNDKTIQTARFVAFISGALASVLALASVIDPELVLGFDITPDRTVLFYLGVFGSIWAVARGLLPDDNTVYDPEIALSEVIEFTHYQPAHWAGRLHSNAVRAEFVQLYQMKIVITIEEVLSMIFTPFVLWYSLPQCSERIIDFFREFTVHVDGIGYVCSFAEFNFQRAGTPRAPAGVEGPPRRRGADVAGEGPGPGPGPGPGVGVGRDLREDYYATKDAKLEASYYSFLNDYARNPKTDVRFPYARRRFQPPAPPPGLLSPSSHPLSSPGRATGFQMGKSGLQSPLTSMLLDPHHQPSGSLMKLPPAGVRPRGAVRSVGKGREIAHSSRLATIPTTEDEEDEEHEEHEEHKTSLSAPHMPTDQGHSGGELGSWKVDGDDDDDEDDEDVDALTRDRGAGGVLGLIRQFQRTHGEGPRPGAGGGAGV